MRSVRFISTIQLSDEIDLNTYVRLQIHILYNEIQAKLDNGNLSSSRKNINIIEKSTVLIVFFCLFKDYYHLIFY